MIDCYAVGEEIAALATKVYVATHGLLARIRQFDEAEGWGEQGAKSCAHWLTWRIGLDPGTAREKVRIARALGALPRIDEAFAAGKLSYAKVRAVTRIATPQNETQALETALAATGAQLEKICHHLRRATEGERQAAEDRRFRARPLGDGLVRLEIVLSSDEADQVVCAIDEARAQLRGAANAAATADASRPTDGDTAGASQPTAADGLMEVVSSYRPNGQDANAAPATASRAEIIVHLERDPTTATPTLTASLDDGVNVSAETFRRLSCDAALVPIVLDHDRNVLDVGRRTRSIPAAIRRALWLRDRGCRFPGCGSRRFLHGHHIKHWLHGGPTSLDNLLFLCSFHHRLVHEGGFSIALTATADVLVTAPTGRTVSAETSDDAAVQWQDTVRIDPMPMPPPLWDGDPPDYDAAVNALVPLTSPLFAAPSPVC